MIKNFQLTLLYNNIGIFTKNNQFNNNAIFPRYVIFVVVATIINRIVRRVHFFLDINDELATFFRKQLSRRHRQKWNRILLTRQKKEGEWKDFSRLKKVDVSISNLLHSPPIDKFSILLIEPPNTIRGQEGRASSLFFLTYSFHDFEDPRYYVTDDDKNVVKAIKNWWEKKYEFFDGLIWSTKKGIERGQCVSLIL